MVPFLSYGVTILVTLIGTQVLAPVHFGELDERARQVMCSEGPSTNLSPLQSSRNDSPLNCMFVSDQAPDQVDIRRDQVHPRTAPGARDQRARRRQRHPVPDGLEPVFESAWLEQDQEIAGSGPGRIPFLLWTCGNAGGTACGARRRIAPTLGGDLASSPGAELRKVCDNLLYKDQGIAHIRSDTYSRQQVPGGLTRDSFPRWAGLRGGSR